MVKVSRLCALITFHGVMVTVRAVAVPEDVFMIVGSSCLLISTRQMKEFGVHGEAVELWLAGWEDADSNDDLLFSWLNKRLWPYACLSVSED